VRPGGNIPRASAESSTASSVIARSRHKLTHTGRQHTRRRLCEGSTGPFHCRTYDWYCQRGTPGPF
jgi:hypothetical protein